MSAGERMELPAPEAVLWIARQLRDAGHQAWAVGGAVRDALSGRPPGDWDLTTSARPGQLRRIFRRTVPIGVEHGTVGVIARDGTMYEVTTFRRDVETDGRHARVAFSDSLEEDLERRDFTINAVAWNPLTGEVRDPHGGMADLRAGVLRTVGDPHDRFAEDRLRVLRALRFAGRFDLRVEPATWQAARQSADRLRLLSAERVREELFKVLGMAVPSRSLQLYRSSGVLEQLYPELQACADGPAVDGMSLWNLLLDAVDLLPPSRPVLRLAALLHQLGTPVASEAASAIAPDRAAVAAARARGVMARLKASNADTDRVVHLVAQYDSLPDPDAADAELRRWVRRVGLAHFRDLIRLHAVSRRARGADPRPLVRLARRLRAVLAERPALEVGQLAIGGAELRSLGLPPGPRYGEILRELLERVTDEPALNTREQLLQLASHLGEQ